MKRWSWLLAAIVVALVGCASFQGVKPIAPAVGNPAFPSVVDSLQPIFRWEPAPYANATYDFIIYEDIKEESLWEGTKHAVGREIYYREGLKAPEHRLEQPLQPDSEYYWSVRLRRGDQVSNWSQYNYTVFLGTAYIRESNRPFAFKTPHA